MKVNIVLAISIKPKWYDLYRRMTGKRKYAKLLKDNEAVIINDVLCVNEELYKRLFTKPETLNFRDGSA